MSDQLTPPPEWTTVRQGSKSAKFVNDTRGLEVSIRAVFRGTKTRHGKTPTHHVIQLQNDWFHVGKAEARNISGKAETWDEALTVALEFMEEFTTERETQSADVIETTHRSVDGDHEKAEQALTTQAAAEALADAAGYSDDLLLEVLAAETNDQYQLVVHREGDQIETVAGDPTTAFEDTHLDALYAAFPVDALGIEYILNDETPIQAVVHLGEHTIYRFIFGDKQETDIILPRGTQVASPTFEQTIANVLEEKW